MSEAVTIPPVPALAIDKYFRDAGYPPLTGDQRLERQIAWTLLHNMAAEYEGITMHIDDGDDDTDCVGESRMLDAMELVFNLDEAVVRFGRAWVLLICGNGRDMISDYGSSDRTNRAVEATYSQLNLA